MKFIFLCLLMVSPPLNASEASAPEEDFVVRLPGCGLPRLDGETDSNYSGRQLEFMIRGFQRGYNASDLLGFLNGLPPTQDVSSLLSPLEDGSLEDGDYIYGNPS